MKDQGTLLIIDDSMIVRERLKTMIMETGSFSRWYEARDWASGKELFDRTSPDTVILDIHLPDGNGMDLLRWIKQHRPKTLVIMLTNYAYAQYERKCKMLGADYFLDKSKEYDRIREMFDINLTKHAV